MNSDHDCKNKKVAKFDHEMHASATNKSLPNDKEHKEYQRSRSRTIANKKSHGQTLSPSVPPLPKLTPTIVGAIRIPIFAAAFAAARS
jgi:hypothetical protein